MEPGDLKAFKEIEMEVVKLVSTYIEANGPAYIDGIRGFGESELEHILRIGTQIMLNHWGLAPYPPGGFVQSFLDNRLVETFAKADHINAKAIRFYVMMMSNLQYPF